MCARQMDDLEQRDPEPLRPYETMLRLEIRQAIHEFDRPASALLLSGTSAGVGVGVGLLLMAIIRFRGGDESAGLAVLSATAYSVGFIIVILGRMDLFTEFTTIAILPVLGGRSSVGALARLWGLIYLGNQIGAACFAALAVTLAPELGLAKHDTFVVIAEEMVRNTWWVILLSGTLAGWLMGAMSWLITGGRDTISQIFFVWLVATAIGLAKLHHSITGAVEVLAGVLVREHLTLLDFGRFLLWATLGNAAGGIVFAAMVHYSLARGQHERGEDSR